MPWPMKNQYLDADDTVGTTFGVAEWLIERSGHVSLVCTGVQSFVIRHDSGRPWTGVDGGEAKASLANIALAVGRRLVDAERRAESAEAEAHGNFRAATSLIAERDISRRASAAWKGLAANYRRSLMKAVDAIYDAEDRAKDAEHRAGQANRALAISAERVDAAEARIRDLDAANSALLVERQRMQADLLRVDAERLDMHDEATHLLTRARNAERRCVELDAELLGRAVTIAHLQYDLDNARGHAAADRIRTSMRLADMQSQRDREATRVSHAEAACRDATGAVIKAEAAVEYARQCVRHGIAACSDEEIMAEHVRRFLASGGI
jgi:chromosome segregation ATPase